jgi:hypothetical protein
MIMAQEEHLLKLQPLLPLLQALQDAVRQAAERGDPAHQVELDIWRRLLRIGYHALAQFFQLQGTGDLGPQLTLPDGTTTQRLEELHPRDYRSVFGTFRLERTAYGTREGQTIAFVPLDARLQLPQGDYSYVLQDWGQSLGVEHAFARVAETLQRVLGLRVPVDSLERTNRHMAEPVTPFRASRPQPPAEQEGELFVAGGDGKGVVMRRTPEQPPLPGHRRKGEKANLKRMACVGVVYSVDRLPRTAEEVVAALFRDPKDPGDQAPPRPEPRHKHVWASLTHDRDGLEVSGTEVVFGWLGQELARRNPGQAKEVVYLMDGQEALWEARREHLPGGNAVEVLDLLHVTPRLWQAAHLFHKEGSAEATAFVRARLLRLLRGEVGGVIGGLRQMATKRGLPAAKRRRLEKALGYLEKNRARMRYDWYLARGYPIASGALEGACRHYVKDRMERAGMHWTKEGAQAMLDVRSTYVNGQWEEFQAFRIERETQRLYPHRQLLDEVPWALAA